MTAEDIANSANAVNYPLGGAIENIVVTSILVFSYLSIIIFFIIIILRLRKNRFEKQSESIKASLNGLIMSATFASNQEELDEVIKQAKPEFLKHIKNSGQAQVMIDEILSMLNNLSGQSKGNLSKLFQETCLMKYTLQKLDNKNWHIKALGIKHLAQVNADKHIPSIEKYATHPIIYLQQQAQIALVNLKGYDGLGFLWKLKNALSDWQQINILDALHELDKDKAPDFSQWLGHEEDTIKLFSIRLIHYFQQSYNNEKVEKFVYSENKKLKNEATATLQKITHKNIFQL